MGTVRKTIPLSPDYEFNVRNGSMITKKGDEIFLEHRLKDFMGILISNKNEVVTREELMCHVWKDMIVSEDSVTKAASDLRKFFLTNQMDEFHLVTIPKLGYKLEISQSNGTIETKTNAIKRPLKIIGYTILGLLITIILIRAVRY